jgi:hypothetical protein
MFLPSFLLPPKSYPQYVAHNFPSKSKFVNFDKNIDNNIKIYTIPNEYNM